MDTVQNYQYCYPNCPQPPHHFPPPPKMMPPLPPHHLPPPPHHFSPPPPPPHVLPPPPAPPGHHPTVIIIIFVSIGGLFFLAFLSVALCCFIKKREKIIQETDIVKVDEHAKVQEAIVSGPHGPQAVILSIDEDVHFEEIVKKNEMVSKGIHMVSTEDHHRPRTLKMASSGSEPSGLHIEDHKS